MAEALAKSADKITVNDMAAYVDELVTRIDMSPYHRGFDQYFILTDSDFRKLRALQRYLNEFAIPYANDLRKIVAKSMKDRRQ